LILIQFVVFFWFSFGYRLVWLLCVGKQEQRSWLARPAVLAGKGELRRGCSGECRGPKCSTRALRSAAAGGGAALGKRRRATASCAVQGQQR